ncbi:MAG: hypothetical protein DHS20C19_16410 [Acidimicrobiales bacterium]|nr:MAG: hypothetical protein DHS20C19_16410 [Acidimicrobiales bacterium]
MIPPPRATRAEFDRADETPRASEREYGTGIYRRRIVVRLDGGHASGELEDDFHHFRVAIEHDGEVVTGVDGSGVRSPWTMCLTAGDPLQAVTGRTLAVGPLALGGLDAKQNCTHMFDLASLVVTHAARGVEGDRQYDMAVDDPDPDTADRHARLWRDGALLLDWHLRDREVLSPDEWREAPLWSGFIPWADAHLDAEVAEAAVALRRACDISRGRLGDLDEMETAEPLLEMMSGICHAFQPANAPLAIRRKGSGRDFTDHPDLLLADFDARN